jgi:hypothetical protein
MQNNTLSYPIALGMEIMKYTLENIFNLSYYGVNNNTTQHNTTLAELVWFDAELI